VKEKRKERTGKEWEGTERETDTINIITILVNYLNTF